MMEQFALYLLKSVIWLSAFALVYYLFLRNERFFLLNRFYLLTGILASFIFPFISIHYTVVVPVFEKLIAGDINLSGIESSESSGLRNLSFLLIILYITGALLVSIKIFRQSKLVINVIKKADFTAFHSVKLIRTAEYPTSFSFFSYVFVNPSVTDLEAKEIMNHELVHVRQKHWVDLVLVELLNMLQWFNPLVWIYSRFIRQNHEYLADEVALQRSSDPAIYRAALLNQIVGSQVIILANSFNHSITKKRFIMMKNIIRSPYRKLKILLVLPVIAIVLYSFAKPEYQYEVIEALPNVIKILETDQDPVTKPVAPQQVEKKVKMGKSDPGAPPPPPPPVKKSDVSSPPPPPPPPPVKASEVDSPPASLLKIRSEGGIPPLFIVNGKEMSESAIEKIDPETINTISVLKDQAATAVFGERGKDGVIMVTTKDVISTVSGEDIMNKDPSADKIEVGGYGNERSSNIILRDYKGGSSSNPLIILDGKVYGNSLERISPNDIQSISVHKDKETIKLYGGKGNDGVIIITSKKK